MADVGELGALLADPRFYEEAMKMPDAKLNKALYGLKQSSREWSETLDTFLREELKKSRLKTEQCIYVRFNEDRPKSIILAVYVDDLGIAGTTQEAISASKQKLLQNMSAKIWASWTGS